MVQSKNNHNIEGGDGDDGDQKGPLTVVLKTVLHCDGCDSKIVRWVSRFEGVETVTSDMASNTLTIVGSMDPSELRDRLQQWRKRRVHLISPQLNGEPPVTTTVFKMRLHCEDCIRKIRRVITKFKGVIDTLVDNQKDLITVTGNIDDKALTNFIKEKLKRFVKIVPPKEYQEVKEPNNVGDGDGEGDAGDDDNSGGGGKGKDKKKGGTDDRDGDNDGGDKVEGGVGGEMKGNKIDFKGQPGFTYRYGYHTGYEDGYPVGQLHAHRRCNYENPIVCSMMPLAVIV